MHLDIGHQHEVIEDYKGYDIIHYINMAKGTNYFYISKNKERASILCLYSIKGCRNIIDTIVRANKNQIWK